MAKTVRIVNYAVNGSGVGHLTRLIAINRWIRRYAAHAGVDAEIWFLTSSEADGMLFSEKFASFKLPSKSVVEDAGIDKLAFLALAKQWVWHSLGLLRPDLLVVDTFPRGSFGELLSALDLARARAFIYRPMKPSFAAKADFQAMLPLYDAIVVPDHEADAPVIVPAEARDRVHYAGPVMVREAAERLSREDARERLGISAKSIAVYVSAGGGGDPFAEAQLLETLDALAAQSDLHLVVGAGPLYRGRTRHGARLTWLPAGAAAEWMNGFDLAVCAAGYNTFFEVMHAGLPTVFLPQPKIADEQDLRAARAVERGAAVIATGPDSLSAAIAAWRDPAARRRAAKAATSLVPGNHARDAAAELLRLVLSPAEVDAAQQAIGDPLLGAARELSLDVETFVEAMRFLDPAVAEQRRRGSDPAKVSALATVLLREVSAREIPVPAALRLTGLLSRKLSGSAAERSEAALRLFDAFHPFSDWAGAQAFLKVFGTERELPAAEFARELGAFLGGLRERGEDLYRGIARLSGAQGTGAALPTNLELLRGAGEAPLRAGKRR